MPPLQFVPARDSRHRHACLALYRALVREGRRIPLPTDILADQSAHPIQHMIRKQFRRNKGDTGPRVVFAALTAGYKFLSLFRQAQTTSSTAHAEVLAHVKRKRLESATSRANYKPKPPQLDKPQFCPKPPPLLTRHRDPDGSVSYTSTLRPAPSSQLRGRRRIPVVFVTSQGVPFLRTKKPQPVRLECALRRQGQRRQARVTQAIELREVSTPAAKDEDNWERLVEGLQREEGRGREREREGDSETFAAAVQTGWQALGRSLQNERLDWVAKTEAYVKIVDEERRMAKLEAGLVEDRWATAQAGQAGNGRDQSIFGHTSPITDDSLIAATIAPCRMLLVTAGACQPRAVVPGPQFSGRAWAGELQAGCGPVADVANAGARDMLREAHAVTGPVCEGCSHPSDACRRKAIRQREGGDEVEM
ncbi:conserved hypothetical protein [Verticillium alfalfae VaMs.102]|uniref:Complex 1 LYR protein domain-containing protein n=1 Tax=Verticillium alfalfae (strain VaMs.102 / ATCC MYA-4576 / FGSC 10136) TaxID=526221 RepID=C9SYQ8_VERA1|nr:conserved hypothetical protein [Verticillium alfalfae VaMs.102]EEY23923.1 conserved hypothetical protein [Verticillium alfalfae VaMs.102]